MITQPEIWKDIIGYEGKYQISNIGEVKSLDRIISARNNSFSFRRGRIMKQKTDKKGYKYVSLLDFDINEKNHRIHRLVATCFLENTDNLPVVNHKDGDKKNNNVLNLEWCTSSHNSQEAVRLGLVKSGANHKDSKVICRLDLSGKALEIYSCLMEASKKTGINSGNISLCANGLVKTAGKFKWKFLMPTKPEVHDKGWGREDWVVNNEKYCGKVLFFEKGKKCSWHFHKIKHETFYLSKGSLIVRHGYDEDIERCDIDLLSVGDVFEIPVGLIHQMEAVEDSELIEFSTQHFESDSYRLIKGN